MSPRRTYDRLCLPAELDGAPQGVPAISLQCYAIAPVKKECANTAMTNAGASCTQEEDCGGAEEGDERLCFAGQARTCRGHTNRQRSVWSPTA